jgi:RNA polymerase sigma-70 factor (ECF subfamily)
LARDPLAKPEELIRRVYAYVAYRLGDGPDAEDITSEVFERALRYRKSYDSARGEPIAWLIGIARRCIEQPHPWVESSAEPEEAPAPGNLEEDAIRRLSVGKAVETLDERDRELIALRFGADLTARQIAEVVGARTNAIEVALHRALGRLRQVVEGEGPAEPDSPAIQKEASL